MTNKDVDSIAYLIDKARKNNQPKPIVFLGAGASISSGIPGTAKIIEDILTDFAGKPEIKKLDPSKKDYYSLMGCLNTEERHNLLRRYITDSAVQINVSHIYLAQMVKEGYIDYVLTVNFDDLFLRACALFNFIPPVYDVSILKEFTTTTLAEGSVTYLHGQYHGFWLLNTGDELNKVKETIPLILNRICNKRTWIIVGYSGEDTIFDHIERLEHFTNELFWVGYNDNLPGENVQKRLLDKPNSNASLISGYNADSFFLKLHAELKLDTPEIFNKPFSFLKGVMGNIKDVDAVSIKGEHKALFENVKDRFEVAEKQVDAAIKQYENNDPTAALSANDIDKDQLKQDIIEADIKDDYQKADTFLEKTATIDDTDIKNALSSLFYNWGTTLLNKADTTGSEELYRQATEKFERACELNPGNSFALNNWANALLGVGRMTKDVSFAYEAIEKAKKAFKINPAQARILNNWGASLDFIAQQTLDKSLLYEALDKYNEAVKIDPRYTTAIENAGAIIMAIAKTLPKGQFEKKMSEAFFKIREAVSLGGMVYNLACWYAIMEEKENALKKLEDSLARNEIKIQSILSDEDWAKYLDDDNFKALISKYAKQEK